MTSNTETPELLHCPEKGVFAEARSKIFHADQLRGAVLNMSKDRSLTKAVKRALKAYETATPPKAEPDDIKTDQKLLDRLVELAGYEMSKEEIDAQRESWVRGQVGHSTSVVRPSEPTDGAPETMWVCTQTVGANHYPLEECPKQAGWTHVSSAPDGCATAYTRKDLSDARIAELEAEVRELQSFDRPECCDGHDCGCRASTPRDWYVYHLEEAEKQLATARNEAFDWLLEKMPPLTDDDAYGKAHSLISYRNGYTRALNDIRALKSEGEG